MPTYNVEDIFEEIPNDPDNVLFKIPDEIAEAVGFNVGDTLTIKQTDTGLVISKNEAPE